MWMLPREDWGIYEDTAPVDVLDLAAELRRWRGIGTAGRLITGRPRPGRERPVRRGNRRVG